MTKKLFEIIKKNAKHFETSEEYKRLTDKICEKIKEKSNSELLVLHEKLLAALNESRDEEIDFYFKEGFKLGLRAGIELME